MKYDNFAGFLAPDTLKTNCRETTIILIVEIDM